MTKFLSFLLFISLSIAFLVTPTTSIYTHVCDPARFSELKLQMSSFAFCDKSLPYAVRVKDLVDRMTLTEKMTQLGIDSTGVPRLGLPPYGWAAEALHGVSNFFRPSLYDRALPGTTIYPTVLLTTASFNESLWKTIGEAISTEARAIYNLGRVGLTFWSPNVNVVRDPRWGRTMETPGEDPLVVGIYAVNHVRGLQDVEGYENSTDFNSRPLKVSSCCKHYTAYDLENWTTVDRYHFDARVTEQDMLETVQLPFEMCIKEAHVSSIMCSYNRINGIPACVDPKLLNQTIRGEWDFQGYVVSDCVALNHIVEDHKYLNDTKEDAIAQALKAGVDLDCIGSYFPIYTVDTVKQGKVREADINKALKNQYMVLMRVGYFDGNPKYNSLGKNDVCSPQNIELAKEAAKEGIVLLKNDNNILPLNSSKFKTLALIGPHANSTTAMLGNHAGIPCHYISPLDGFSAYANVTYSMGCGDVTCKNQSLIFPAAEAAKNTDATIILAGLDLSMEDEALDRQHLLLPGYQTELINKVAQVAKGPIILVIMSGGCVDISFAKNNTRINAILWAGYPGQEGGRAIADIVFGKYNPGGRLPITWYEADYVNKLPMTSMPLRPIDSLGYPGRTYKFFYGSTVYPFGYGLSYTQFKYNLTSSNISISIKLDKFQHCFPLNYINGTQQPPLCPAVLTEDLKCNDSFEFEMGVQNVGNEDGTEVVMVYSKPPSGISGTHIKQVIGFQKVFVAVGQIEKVKFVFNACKSLKIVDYAANVVLPSGKHTIIVGDNGASFPINVNFSY